MRKTRIIAAKIKKKIKRRLFIRKLKHKLLIPKGKKVFIIGSPTHTNLGDSAIFLAQKQFISKVGVKSDRIIEITFEEFYKNRRFLKEIISTKFPIFCLGGGNMGNQWIEEEQLRYDLIDSFPNHKLTVFPQTLFFLDNSEKFILESANYYNNKNTILIAREKESFDLMKRYYPNAEILLVPDIVLSTKKEDYNIEKCSRKGVLFCVRTDVEKQIDDNVWLKLKEEFENMKIDYRQTDMNSDLDVTKENRIDLVNKKMQQFCQAQLVITDRLHGMIFSAITETPCIVFSNYNHKVKGTYEWIKYLPYIKYVETLEEAEKLIPRLLSIDKCEFDNKPLETNYSELAEVVKERCRKSV